MGILWASMAAKEGHRRGIPPGANATANPEHPMEQTIRRMQAEGKTRVEIAQIIGMSKSRISQIAPLK